MEPRTSDWVPDDVWRGEAHVLLTLIEQLELLPVQRRTPEVLRMEAGAHLECHEDTWTTRVEVLQDVLFSMVFLTEGRPTAEVIAELDEVFPRAGRLFGLLQADCSYAVGTLLEDIEECDLESLDQVREAPAVARWLLGHDNPRTASRDFVAAALAVLVNAYVYGPILHNDDDEVIAMWARDDVHAQFTPVRPMPWPDQSAQPTFLVKGDPATGVPANERLWQQSAIVTGTYDGVTFAILGQTHTVRFVVASNEVAIDCYLVRPPSDRP